MRKAEFRTNINCSGCVAKVTPYLNKEDSIEKWSVDTTIAEKTLVVEGSEIDVEKVIKTVRDAGFKIEEKQ